MNLPLIVALACIACVITLTIVFGYFFYYIEKHEEELNKIHDELDYFIRCCIKAYLREHGGQGEGMEREAKDRVGDDMHQIPGDLGRCGAAD